MYLGKSFRGIIRRPLSTLPFEEKTAPTGKGTSFRPVGLGVV